MASGDGGLLSASHIVEYPYRRSTGPVMGRFFAALRDRRFEGVKTARGRVLVPPTEYDPQTGEAADEMVPVGPGGVVTTWAWVSHPRAKHPLNHPFAWALIQLDGADTAMLHAVDTGVESAMQTGMRVTPRWRAQTVGSINDVACFEPEGTS